MTAGRISETKDRVERLRFIIILTVALAWAGLLTHELYRVPSALGLTLDGSLPLLAIAAALLVWWLRAANKRGPTLALLIYGLINAIGGFLSVLPLPFLPFVPDQTLDHYLVHVWYALCQVPLIAVTFTTLLALLARRTS
jgi:hypothetical protein